MSAVRFVVARPDDLAGYVDRLRALERSIRYPVGDGDEFFIDHGPAYHPFFSQLGEAWFLLALRGEELLGSVTGVVRSISRAGKPLDALYICDLKVKAEARGTGLARRMLLNGFTHLFRQPALRKCRFLYGAAMRGARGDVMRSVRGWNPLRLGRVSSRVAMYFVPPARIAALDLAEAPPPPEAPGLVLGPSARVPLEGAGYCTTAGRKDLRLESTGEPWPLVHLAAPPAAWKDGWGGDLRRAGEELASRSDGPLACFTVDERLADHVEWLRARGISPDTTCSVYALDLSFSRGAPAWLHLPSSEI
jgi:hypothetical protein